MVCPERKKISLSRVAEDAARHEMCRALRRVVRFIPLLPLCSAAISLPSVPPRGLRAPIPRSRAFVAAAAVTAARPLLHTRSA
jgi:hypothetical protein